MKSNNRLKALKTNLLDEVAITVNGVADLRYNNYSISILTILYLGNYGGALYSHSFDISVPPREFFTILYKDLHAQD